jgi:hypothetical protein
MIIAAGGIRAVIPRVLPCRARGPGTVGGRGPRAGSGLFRNHDTSARGMRSGAPAGLGAAVETFPAGPAACQPECRSGSGGSIIW